MSAAAPRARRDSTWACRGRRPPRPARARWRTRRRGHRGRSPPPAGEQPERQPGAPPAAFGRAGRCRGSRRAQPARRALAVMRPSAPTSRANGWSGGRAGSHRKEASAAPGQRAAPRRRRRRGTTAARARRAVDVAELGAGLRDLGVGVPAAAAEERRRQAELLAGAPLVADPLARDRRRSAGRGRARPVRVVAERPAATPPPRALEPDRLVLAVRRGPAAA